MDKSGHIGSRRCRFRRTLLSVCTCLLLVPAVSRAQVPVEDSSPAVTRISPKFFGPYAFPVPDLMEGRIRSGLYAELAGDAVAGRIGGDGSTDWTWAPTFRVSIPLWTDRASLSIWGELHEWYRDTPAAREARRVSAERPLSGHNFGNLWFALEIQALLERERRPSVSLRAATLSANGDGYALARHYDAPGYFFDVSAGKSFRTGAEGRLRVSATAGFVCWQTDRGRQNDAWLLGMKLSWSNPRVSCSAEYGQYNGWEKNRQAESGIESGDCPMALKSRIELHFGSFSPFIYMQYGLRDWPFTQLRLGLAWSFDLLGSLRSGQAR